MRRLIFQMMISLDGYFEGSQGSLDWHIVDKEFNDYAVELLKSVDGLIFGHRTYDLMESYWTSPDALHNDPEVTPYMNDLTKYVFSKELKSVHWKNTILIHSDPAVEISRIKKLPGKNMAIFGSSNLMLSLIDKGVVDEYRIFISPTILGQGNSLFKGLGKRVNLKLRDSRVLKSGNVLLKYVEK
ncbi:MAG: dihydrofolate reductase family protein [Chitinophagales bacterium]